MSTSNPVGFRCRFPNNCACCPPNRLAFEAMTDEIERLRAQCVWIEINPSQWEAGCAQKFINGNIDDLKFCAYCGGKVHRG